MRWQKIARVAIAVFVLVFAGVVFVALRRPAPPVTRATTPRQKADTTAEVGPLEHKRFDDKTGKLTISVKAKSQFTYGDGRNVLHDAEVTLPDRDGRTLLLSGTEMEVTPPQTGNDPIDKATITKGARLKASDGLEVTSDQAHYDHQSGLVTVPGDVQFKRGRLTGSGVGATYDKNRDVLWLLDKAKMTVVPDEKGGGAVEATAKAAGLARADHYIRLTENAHVVREGRTLDATELTVQLSPDDKVIQSMALRGNSRIAGAAGGSGAEGMSARDIDLTYSPDGATLQSARLMENALAELAGGGGAGSRKISARTIELGFGADGSTVTRLNAAENVQVDLPAAADSPARRINSASLNGSGAAGLETATFGGGVTYRELRPAGRGDPAGERTGRSQRLIVETQPGFGNIQRADFRSNVRIVDGDSIVEGPRVVYRVAEDSFDVAPSAEDTGPPPSVNDGKVLVHARTISFTVGTKKLIAETDVRSSMQSAASDKNKPATGTAGRGRGSASGEPTKLPSVLKQNEPVQVTANRLEYDGGAGLAKYSGNAKLWQDKTRIQGDAIDLDDRSANLTSRGHVASVMFLEETDAKTKATRLVETTATADLLVYDDGKRLATYTAGPTANAHLVGSQGDVTANEIQLFLKPSANELDRAEADGNVVLKEGKRTGTGAHLTYTPENETYVMTGSPVEVEERVGNECRFSSATTLTFDRSSDRMLMANNQVAPVKLRQCTAK